MKQAANLDKCADALIAQQPPAATAEERGAFKELLMVMRKAQENQVVFLRENQAILMSLGDRLETIHNTLRNP